jgi:hypothetical protein
MRVYRLKYGPRADFATLRGIDEPGNTQMIDGFWAKPMKSTWRKVRVERRIESAEDASKPLADYTHDVSFPLFGERACVALGDDLKRNGELLDTLCEEAKYWYYNPLTVLDALDENKTEFYGKSHQISRYVFHSDRLKNASIFKIALWPKGATIFVTESFVRQVRAAGLTGFQPLLVWSDEDEVIRRFDMFDLPVDRIPN